MAAPIDRVSGTTGNFWKHSDCYPTFIRTNRVLDNEDRFALPWKHIVVPMYLQSTPFSLMIQLFLRNVSHFLYPMSFLHVKFVARKIVGIY